MQSNSLPSPEADRLRGTSLPQDLLVTLFALVRPESDAHILRLVSKEWRRLFDSSLPSVRLDRTFSDSAKLLSQLRGLTEVDLSTSLATGAHNDGSGLETVLAAASRLPKLQSLTLGLQAMLRAPEAQSAAAAAAADPAAASSAAEVGGSLTAVVTAPCSRTPYLPAAAVAALTRLRRLSIGAGARPGDPPVELPYGSLPEELPLELLQLRSLEDLELYGIPLVPRRGLAQELSQLSLLSSLRLSCSAPSLVRSSAHLTRLTALRRLGLHCTSAHTSTSTAAAAAVGLGMGPGPGVAAGMAVEEAPGVGDVEAEAEEWPPPAAAASGAGGPVAAPFAPPPPPLPPPPLPARPPGGASSGRSIVAMLSTNCLLFGGLQRLAEAGVALTELSYRGAFLTLPPPYLRNWTSLESLDLSHNTLMLDEGLLESQITRLTRLTHLDLSYNRLDELPAALCSSLTGLRSLDVSHNLLTALPPSISALSRLTLLAAAENWLAGLGRGERGEEGEGEAEEGGLTALTQLRHLDVSGNRLGSLPEGLTRLSDLEELRVSRNRLTALPGLTTWPRCRHNHHNHHNHPGGAADSRTTTATATAAAAAPERAGASAGPGAACGGMGGDVGMGGGVGMDAGDGDQEDERCCGAVGPSASSPLATTAALLVPPPLTFFPSLTFLDLSSNHLDLLPTATLGRMSRLRTLICGQNYFKACTTGPDPEPYVDHVAGELDPDPDPEPAPEQPPRSSSAATSRQQQPQPDQAPPYQQQRRQQPPPRPPSLRAFPSPSPSPFSLGYLREGLMDLDIRMTAAYLAGVEAFLEAVGQLTALTSLNAQANGLQSVPPSWTRLTRLEALDLSSNALVALPPGLSALRRLRALKVAANRLATTAAAAVGGGELVGCGGMGCGGGGMGCGGGSGDLEVLTALVALTSLDLSRNLLTGLPLCSLPASLTRLARLRKLDVSRNYGLKELPYGTADLPCLLHVVVGKALAEWQPLQSPAPTGAAAAVVAAAAAAGTVAGDRCGGGASSGAIEGGNCGSSSSSSGAGAGVRGCSQVALLAARGVQVQVVS